MSILQEFKEFAIKGNVVDMAVGVIIGGAFGTIVSSLVKDVIMPPIGVMLGGVDFSNVKFPCAPARQARPGGHEHRRVHQQRVISFMIVALAVFMLVKAINELRKRFERGEEGRTRHRHLAVGDLPARDPRRAREKIGRCGRRTRPSAPATWRARRFNRRIMDRPG